MAFQGTRIVVDGILDSLPGHCRRLGCEERVSRIRRLLAKGLTPQEAFDRRDSRPGWRSPSRHSEGAVISSNDPETARASSLGQRVVCIDGVDGTADDHCKLRGLTAKQRGEVLLQLARDRQPEEIFNAL
jgi:hypothetical protein